MTTLRQSVPDQPEAIASNPAAGGGFVRSFRRAAPRTFATRSTLGQSLREQIVDDDRD